MIHIATCITGYEKLPTSIDIGFLGYNAKLTEYGLKQFIENNEEDIDKVYWIQKVVFLKDGTKIKGLTTPNDIGLRGFKIDQLILFDDNRWEIEWARAEEIRIIKALTMQVSNVPEEFLILKYEDIR